MCTNELVYTVDVVAFASATSVGSAAAATAAAVCFCVALVSCALAHTRINHFYESQ